MNVQEFDIRAALLLLQAGLEIGRVKVKNQVLVPNSELAMHLGKMLCRAAERLSRFDPSHATRCKHLANQLGVSVELWKFIEIYESMTKRAWWGNRHDAEVLVCQKARLSLQRTVRPIEGQCPQPLEQYLVSVVQGTPTNHLSSRDALNALNWIEQSFAWS